MIRFLLLTGWVLAATAGAGAAEPIRIAVASNAAEVLRSISARFEAATGHRVVVSAGSTGKHFAQIQHGAPFDAFFAADAWRPGRLEEAGRAIPGTRFSYARGQLVLWSAEPGVVDSEGRILDGDDTAFRRLAIANPRLAPYGRAAREVLEAQGRWATLQDRMVKGENVGQTFQFVATGNARIGFVARSQVMRPGHPADGSWWEVPDTLYTPIDQQAVLLTDSGPAREFLDFVRGDEALKIFRRYGYSVP